MKKIIALRYKCSCKEFEVSPDDNGCIEDKTFICADCGYSMVVERIEEDIYDINTAEGRILQWFDDNHNCYATSKEWKDELVKVLVKETQGDYDLAQTKYRVARRVVANNELSRNQMVDLVMALNGASVKSIKKIYDKKYWEVSESSYKVYNRIA